VFFQYLTRINWSIDSFKLDKWQYEYYFKIKKILGTLVRYYGYYGVEVLDEKELFIDKKVIFDEKTIPAVRRLSANFVIRPTFFPFNLDTFPFQVFWT
jgi:hypothetical protein